MELSQIYITVERIYRFNMKNRRLNANKISTNNNIERGSNDLTNNNKNNNNVIFARDSIYAIARIRYRPSVCLSVRPSVRPSVRHTGGSVKNG